MFSHSTNIIGIVICPLQMRKMMIIAISWICLFIEQNYHGCLVCVSSGKGRIDR